jgi:hypothetical protein
VPYLSADLKKDIALYCHEVDALLIGDLVKNIEAGDAPYFVDEFAEAIRYRLLTPHVWGVLTETYLDHDDYEQTDEDLRYVWSQVAPGKPFPGGPQVPPIEPRRTRR